MTADDALHRRRDRAGSFGTAAAAYDRFRPSYPAALVDDLVATGAETVLDVGCGTGKAARLLTARGLSVLGVEPDPRMAEIARGHGIPVEVAAFESWPAAGRTFDLLISGQAWHWVEPAPGAAKAADVLRPGGTFAVFWNYDDISAATREVLDTVYARLAPDLHSRADPAGDRRRQPYADDVRAERRLTDVEQRTYPWHRKEPADDFVERLATHSDHLLLGPQRLAAVRGALRTALIARGPTVEVTGATSAIFARRTG